MQLRNLLDRVAHSPSPAFTSFRIPDGQVTDAGAVDQDTGFVPEETYFEVRLSQMHLQYGREYWRQFIPLASFMTQFQYAGTRQTVPFVVGPELLGGVAQLDKRDHVEFRNVRVAGPYPYTGDDLELFVGLFRVVTSDWAGPALSLLESVTKAFDLSKLSSFVSVTQPLVSGVEGLFGMREVEARMATYRQLTPPADEPGQRRYGDVLRPGFHLLVGEPADRFGDRDRQALRIADGMLWRRGDNGELAEFKDADFLLFQLVPLLSRPDYTTFDFHKVYWQKVVDHIWNDHEDAARQALRLLEANLAQCQDITTPHRYRLLRKYRKQFEEELAQYQILDEEAPGQGFEEAPRSDLGEADLRAAVESSGGPAGSCQPEEMLVQLGG